MATIRLIVLMAIRDRLLTGLFALLAVTASLSLFLGGTVINEQSATAVVFAAGAGRFVLVLGLAIFAAFHIQALFESREVEAILSRAISRARFVIAYWLGLTLLAIVLAGVFAAFVVVVSGFSGGSLLWAGTLIAECIIVLAVVLFAGLMLERATLAVLFTMGFYALARLMGFFVGIRETATDFTVLQLIMKRVLDFVLLFVPRLDLFAQSRWLVYGASASDVSFSLAQTVLFLGVILLASIFDLQRKQF